MDKDIYFMKKTFSLAKKGDGFTSPNPLVGAVIVKNNRIISTGYHKKAGLAHAEIEAIRKAAENLNNSTLYVNLEPCCHFGKTPPCVDAIIKAGIKKIVIASIDPNPIIKGRSINKLKKNGVKVILGVLKEEAEKLNEVFFKNMREKSPFVAAKIAQSFDGKIVDKYGKSKWITAERSRLISRKLRDKYDCVLVGINTAIKDNPHLNGIKKTPFKTVIDPYLRIPIKSFIVKENPEKLIIFVSSKIKNSRSLKIKYDFLTSRGVKIIFVKEEKRYIKLKYILSLLYQSGVTSVFVEGGSQTLGGFFDEKLVDKIYFFISNKILGGENSLTSIRGKGFSIDASPQLRDITIKMIGDNILASAYPCYKGDKCENE